MQGVSLFAERLLVPEKYSVSSSWFATDHIPVQLFLSGLKI
jgi:hypothetical protein